jgi:CDP-diacylglycerol--glycerol-3-phosphate 3-phosphatidyltransferase
MSAGSTPAAAKKPSSFNLPNTISAARILISPLIALLPFAVSPLWRTVAFVLYVISAVSDYWDGWLARTRGLVTDLGKALDPLADKLLLVATFVPMLVLQGAADDPASRYLVELLHVEPGIAAGFPFITNFGSVTLSSWVVALVLGREAFMTIFREAANRKGVVIAAIGPAKWKAGMQYVWVGAAYFWFAARTLAGDKGWSGPLWNFIVILNGWIGVVTMVVAVALTMYSLWLYLQRYGALVFSSRPK